MKSFSIATVMAFASVVALLCAGLIAQTTAATSSEANPFQVAIWQRETQTLIMIGVYFALLAILMLLGKFMFTKKREPGSIPQHDHTNEVGGHSNG